MIKGKWNCIVDALWGSCGKGKWSATLAKLHSVTDASTCNGPNAGHTVVDGALRQVFKVLPSATPYVHRVWLGPGSAFRVDRLQAEVAAMRSPAVVVHERAAVVTDDHAKSEQAHPSLRGLASTTQGTAAAYAGKLYRLQSAVALNNELGDDVSMLAPHLFRSSYHAAIGDGTMLHEVAQGWALSIDHGSHYPQCTSRNCTAQGAMDYMAVTPRQVGDVYLVARVHPIRVGNADGWSGGWWGDNVETTWEDLLEAAGCPRDLVPGFVEAERTTVTKRIRRVATPSIAGIAEAARYSGATKILLNFVQYLDWAALGVRKLGDLPRSVIKFAGDVERACDVPVVGFGTGEQLEDCVVLA